MSERKKMVTGVFRNRYDGERAFDYLQSIGYLDREINLLMSESTRTSEFSAAVREKQNAKSKAAEGMGVGGAIGTAVGATIAAIAAIGTTIALPGVGLIVAGPLAAAFAGGGAGAVTGGLLGTLVGAGMTEQNAEAYDEALRNGGIVIGVVPRKASDAADIERKFSEFNGENVCYC